MKIEVYKVVVEANAVSVYGTDRDGWEVAFCPGRLYGLRLADQLAKGDPVVVERRDAMRRHQWLVNNRATG